MTSLAKLKKGSSSSYYNESSSTLEKLSILKAWAEVYIVSMKSSHAKMPNDNTVVDDDDFDDNFGDFTTTPGSGGGRDEEDNSLSSLVAAELPRYGTVQWPPVHIYLVKIFF